jgi:hypothetical protein
MNEQPNIRNKEIRRVRVADVEDAPWNFRTHPDSQAAALEGLIDEIGFYSYPDVYESDGGVLRLIDGHLRKALLVRKYGPDAEIEVNVTTFSEAEAKKATLTKDPLAAMATTDAAALDALLREVETGSEELSKMLAELADEAGLYHVDESDAPELADGDKAPFQQMTFTLHDSQAEVVRRAMEKAKEADDFSDCPNENSNGNALAVIAEAYCGQR